VLGAKVLVIEDDLTVAEVVSRYLEGEGFSVESVHDGPSGLDRALQGAPDLVLLDLMLPGLDGVEICRRLRAARAVPIIVLTARGQESDRVRGLELGADDYVVKPFSPRELMARVKSVLRRARQPATETEGQPVLEAGGIIADVSARTVTVRGEPVALTVREFDLLSFLMRHPRHVFRRGELLERVWGYSFGDLSTVTVHIRRLREKIERDPSEPERIQTVWGVGYRFES
jgi:DNA-binding response OmpR family regulator